jgi:hypothetical protein
MSDDHVVHQADDADPVYAELSAPFAQTFKDTRGGVDIEYLSGEQVITRLNTVLGVFNWRFVIQADGVDEDADEVWVRGQLAVRDPATNEWIEREQYGSQKIHRPRPNCGFIFAAPREGEVCDRSSYQHPADHPYVAGARKPALDIGFDRKGAGTDCLKKVATLFGVGLYLSHKEAQPGTGRAQAPRQQAQSGSRDQAARQQQPRPQPARPPVCATCRKALPMKHDFADGSTWTQQQIAEYGTTHFNAVLCIDHLRARRDAEGKQPAQTQSA